MTFALHYKRRRRAAAFLAVLGLFATAVVANAATELDELYAKKDCFALRDALQRRPATRDDLLFFRAAVSNAFNQPQRSIVYLNEYLRLQRRRIPADRLLDSYTLLADNYLKTYQYGKAAAVLRLILNEPGSTLDPERRNDYQNSQQLWSTLSAVAPQSATFHGTTFLRGNIKAVPFEINGEQLSFGMDSGASLSIIIRSLAQHLGLRLTRSTIKIGSITGETVQAELGIANRIEIGNVTLRNVVFLIIADEDLLGPSEGEVKGVLGYPVIAALREITFEREGKITIPARAGLRGEQNLCMDGSKPLLAAEHAGTRLVFAFDTGASHSILYPPFYRRFENEIKSRYSLQSAKINGVGGSKQIPAYRLQNFALLLSGKKALLPEIPVLIEETLDESKHVNGNLGNDLVVQFKSMTINFAAMSVVFR